MDYHENCHDGKGNHANHAGRCGTNKGISAVYSKIHTDGTDAVDGTVPQNGGDTAFCFQGYIGKENTHYDAEYTHHGDAGEGETPIANAVVVTNDGQRSMQ